jgi:acetyltransferase
MIRPIGPEDETKLIQFQASLSSASVYRRYFSQNPLCDRLEQTRLAHTYLANQEDEIVLIAEQKTSPFNVQKIVGVASLSRIGNTHEAEFAIVVGDESPGQGIGSILLRQLLQAGREKDSTCVIGYILTDNIPMVRVCLKLGFQVGYDKVSHTRKALINL